MEFGMDNVVLILQITTALGIYNVWFLRYNLATGYRGGTAQSLKEEFATYGLPFWFFILIGILKICCATCLIVGVWYPMLTKYAAGALGLLMIGALGMHLKVKDQPSKFLPAMVMLSFCIIIFLNS
jgi:uncharacterized membrane protein YphA (DoxX/SURF4 family)